MDVSRTATVEFVSRVGRAVTAALLLAIFIRVLGADPFGSFVLFEALAALVTIVVDLGIGSAVQKRLSGGSSSDVLTTALLVEFGMLIVATLIVFSFQSPINGYLGAELSTLIPIAVGAQQLGRLSQHTLRGELRVAEAAVIQLVGEVAVLPIGFLLVESGMGVRGVVVAFIIGRAAIGVVGFARSNQSIAAPSLEAARSIVQFAKYNFFSATLGGTVYTWVDTLIIGIFLTQGAVTAYETAWRVGMAVSLVSQAIGTTLFPQVSDWIANENTRAIERALPNAISGALLLVFPAIVGGALFGREILGNFFGASVVIAAPALVVILFGKIPQSLNDVVTRTLLGLDRPDAPAIASILFVVVNVSLNVVLIPEFGLIGAALGTTIAFGVKTAIVGYFLNRFVNIKIPWRNLGVSLVASLLMGLSLVLFSTVFAVSSLLDIVVVVAFGTIVYSIGILSNKSMRKNIFELVGF